MQGWVSVISSLKLEDPSRIGVFSKNCDAENLQNFVPAQVEAQLLFDYRHERVNR